MKTRPLKRRILGEIEANWNSKDRRWKRAREAKTPKGEIVWEDKIYLWHLRKDIDSAKE